MLPLHVFDLAGVFAIFSECDPTPGHHELGILRVELRTALDAR
jgi:hypothetical protein